MEIKVNSAQVEFWQMQKIKPSELIVLQDGSTQEVFKTLSQYH